MSMGISQLQELHFNARADTNNIPVKDLSSERIPDGDVVVQNEVYRGEVRSMNEGLDIAPTKRQMEFGTSEEQLARHIFIANYVRMLGDADLRLFNALTSMIVYHEQMAGIFFVAKSLQGESGDMA